MVAGNRAICLASRRLRRITGIHTSGFQFMQERDAACYIDRLRHAVQGAAARNRMALSVVGLMVSGRPQVS
jgi:hypothetical protein